MGIDVIRSEPQYLRIYRVVQQLVRQADHTYGSLKKDLLAKSDQFQDLLDRYDASHHVAVRKGPWMPTFSGHRCWLLDPRPGDFVVEDIARGLSRLNRYLGGTREGHGYSVAQHCVLGSWIIEPQWRLSFLMHDAPEAYTGDIITPVKEILGPVFCDMENRIMWAMAKQYRFAWTDKAQAAVKWADATMLNTEVRDLVPYRVLRQPPPEAALPFRIRPWSAARARAAFLERFWELVKFK
jgi:hypothetical protein